MRLWRHSPSRFDEALNLLAQGDRERRAILRRSTQLPYTAQDVAGALLGDDLWFDPLRDYRAYLRSVNVRPHLWGFTFEESGGWQDARWQAMSLSTRVARARCGSLTQSHKFSFAPASIGLTRDQLKRAMGELCALNLSRRLVDGTWALDALAPASELERELYLVEIIAHWLGMLAHADVVAQDNRPSGYEVAGYDEACPACKLSWGVRPRAAGWIPPFHPGCRCFAQPRFAR